MKLNRNIESHTDLTDLTGLIDLDMSDTSSSSSAVNIPPKKFRKTPRVPLRQTYWRWIVLVLINVIILGDFMALEGPQPIETPIKSILNLNEEQYSMLYSSWALPSVFSPLLGGYLTDKFGARPTLVIFSVIVTVGQFIHAIGGYTLNFSWMLMGRAIYALGTDPLDVAQMVMTTKWFQGKEIAFAMAISGLTLGLGRGLNSFLTPIIYDISKSLGTPMMFAAFICLLGTVASLVMVKWDKENDSIELELDSEYLTKMQDKAEKIQFSDIKHFRPIVWTLILEFGILYACSFSFNAFTNDFYHERYEFTNVEAGSLIAANFFIMAISSSIFGNVVDNYGLRATMLMYNSFLGVVGFLYYWMYPTCMRCFSVIIPQILFGLQLGIGEAAIFPCLPLVLEERFLGTGYGLFFVFQNLFVLVLTSAAGYIKDATDVGDSDGYSGILLFFFVWNCVTIYLASRLLKQSNKLGRILDRLVKKEKNEEDLEERNELLK